MKRWKIERKVRHLLEKEEYMWAESHVVGKVRWFVRDRLLGFCFPPANPCFLDLIKPRAGAPFKPRRIPV